MPRNFSSESEGILGMISVCQIGELFGRAYMKAVTAEVSVGSGFGKAGLFPYCRNNLRSRDFAVLDT
jgi:hypothetical protein